LEADSQPESDVRIQKDVDPYEGLTPHERRQLEDILPPTSYDIDTVRMIQPGKPNSTEIIYDDGYSYS
jgi:hypothetical protein